MNDTLLNNSFQSFFNLLFKEFQNIFISLENNFSKLDLNNFELLKKDEIDVDKPNQKDFISDMQAIETLFQKITTKLDENINKLSETRNLMNLPINSIHEKEILKSSENHLNTNKIDENKGNFQFLNEIHEVIHSSFATIEKFKDNFFFRSNDTQVQENFSIYNPSLLEEQIENIISITHDIPQLSMQKTHNEPQQEARIENSLNVNSINLYTSSSDGNELAKTILSSLEDEFNTNLVLSSNTGVRVKG